MKGKIWFLAGLISLGVRTSFADNKAVESDKNDGEPSVISVIDTPTSEVLDPQTYSYTSRFYSEGGVAQKFLVAPLRRVHLGIAFDVQNLIGGGSPRMIRPSVFFKVRAYDGSDVLPSLALGYENLGELWSRTANQYSNREKGLYAVMSHEILIPDLEVHGGINVYDFNSDSALYGFVGATYKLTRAFQLLAEYDNLRSGPTQRVNLGGRLYITPFLNVDLAARNVGRDSDRGAERIVQLNYVGRFTL